MFTLVTKMSQQMFLLFSHTLTAEQQHDATHTFDLSALVVLPANLQALWSNIPPHEPNLRRIAGTFTAYLEQKSRKGDVVLVQGDYGMTFFVVDWCRHHNRIAVYSTTERLFTREPGEDGAVINRHRFKHVAFRRYENAL